MEEAAETVKLIFTQYLGGCGLKAIAKLLNEQERKTPAMVQLELIHKKLPNTQDGIKKKYLWDATMVKRILENEIYTGTLINHKSERNKINKTFHVVPESEQFRHDDFLPAIVTKETWEQARFLLGRHKRDNIRAGHNQPIHRYAGLLKCGDCGRTFVGKRKRYQDGTSAVDYLCDTYIRYGKEHCSSHAIREDTLDRLIAEELLRAKRLYQSNWNTLEQLIDRWMPKVNLAEGQIKKLKERLQTLEEEIESILLERIRDRDNAQRYGRMIEKRESEMQAARRRIGELENLSDTIRKKQSAIKKDISMMDDILSGDKISEVQLRLLIDNIKVYETEAGLDVKISIKAPFRTHMEEYDENGEVTASYASLDFDFDRLAPLLFDDCPVSVDEKEVS